MMTKKELLEETTITGDQGMAEFQLNNCKGCYFADKPRVGTGEPCCQYAFRLDVTNKGTKCLTKREV